MTDKTDGLVAEVLGKVPSGCGVLTATHKERSTGVLVSWVQQASFEPLLLTVAVRQRRPILNLIERSGRFVLNLLGSDPKEMFQHFGKGFAPEEPAFEGLPCRSCDYGVILEDVLGYLECTVESKTQAGDHWLYIAKPISADLLGGGEPYVHMRKTALGY